MAIITLEEGETLGFTLAGENTVFGTVDGEETVTIGGGNQTLDASFNAGGDTIVFTGASTSYSVSRSGSSIIITGPGNTVVTIPVPNPSLDDADRPVIEFSDASFALDTTVTDDGAVITIGDQEITAEPTAIGGGDPQPTGIILDVSVGDVVEGSGDIVYTFTLSEAPTAPVTINVSTIGGTATQGSDYTAVSQTITFAAGQTTAFLTVDVLDDAVSDEPDETVVLSVTTGSDVTLAEDADLTAVITDNDGDLPQSFELTTGADTVAGGSAADRISGVQNIFLPGKLLSQADTVNGGEGDDTLVLINAAGGTPNVLDDVDFTQTSSVEILETNYNQITLGEEAAEAGLVRVDTSLGDTQIVGGGTLLDISSADFTNELTVVMANSFADQVITDLGNGADSIDTGSNTLAPNGAVAAAPIDEVQLVNQVNPVRITFTSTAAGNGSSVDEAGNLALTAQSEDDADGLVGDITRFDDEGIRFSGGQFDVRDISGTQRGTFAEVVIGTMDDDLVFAGVDGAYINAGMGDDTLIGDDGVDFLVGGAGDDYLEAGAGNDSILGGAGDDIIDGGRGRDTLDGGAGSDTYFFDNGEFIVDETITDDAMGMGAADDVDTLVITSVTPITDAPFEGKLGFEALVTNVTSGFSADGVAEVTLGENAEAAGIVSVDAGDDDLDASGYGSDLTASGSGDIATGAGADTINITAGFQSYVGAVDAGAGDDTINGGYAIGANNPGNSIDGGDGDDTFTLGGMVGASVGALTYVDPLGDDFVNIETIEIQAAEDAAEVDDGDDAVGNAISYTFEVSDSNFGDNDTLVIDGSALRADVVVDLGSDNELGGSGGAQDDVEDETIEVDASSVSADFSVEAIGGASDDILRGGAGADTLTGNDGDDFIEGGAGNDNLDGGEGSDTYFYTGNRLASGEIVNDSGSEGVDSIVVQSTFEIEDIAFTNKSGIEELVTNIGTGVAGDGDAEVTLGTAAEASGITTVRTDDDDIDAGDYVSTDLLVFTGTGGVITGGGDDEVRIAQSPLFTATNNGPIALGAGNDVLNTYYNADYSVADFDGGEGDNDQLLVGGAYSIHTVGVPNTAPGGNVGNDQVGFDVFLGDDIVGFERMVINAPEAAVEVDGDDDIAGNTIAFNVVVDDDNIAEGGVLIVDASGLTTDVAVDLGDDDELGGDGADEDTLSESTLTFDGSSLSLNRAVQVLGGDGADDLTGGSGNDRLNGGAGDDIVVGAGGADVLNGAAGEDQLFGGDGADRINGGDDDDLLVGGAGFDTIDGGAGDDTVRLNVTEFNSDNDRINGGEGNDTLEIVGTDTDQEIADVGFNERFTSLEEVTLVGGPGNTAFTYTAGFFSEEAGVRVINLGADTDGSEVSVANYSEAGAELNGGDGSDTLTGSQFADEFTDGLGADTINGGGGNDVITLDEDVDTDFINGGAQNDEINLSLINGYFEVINGGSGSDTLNLTAAYDPAAGDVNNVSMTFDADAFSLETVVLEAGLEATDTDEGSANSYSLGITNASFEADGGTMTIDASALRDDVDVAGGTDEFVFVDGVGLDADNRLNVIGGDAGDFVFTGDGADSVNGGAGVDTIDTGAGNDSITGGAGGDFLNGGAGVDTIILTEGTAARDTVTVDDTESARSAADTVVGFAVDTDNGEGANAGLSTTADVINFGEGIITTTSASIENGFVIDGSDLQDAIDNAGSLLAAIQIVEQEFQSGADPDANEGIVAFVFEGDTYIGEISSENQAGIAEQGFETFTDIVRLEGVTNATALVDNGGFDIGLVVNP